MLYRSEKGNYNLNLVWINQNSVKILAPTGIPIGAKSLGKRVITIQIWFDLTRFLQHSRAPDLMIVDGECIRTRTSSATCQYLRRICRAKLTIFKFVAKCAISSWKFQAKIYRGSFLIFSNIFQKIPYILNYRLYSRTSDIHQKIARSQKIVCNFLESPLLWINRYAIKIMQYLQYFVLSMSLNIHSSLVTRYYLKKWS